MHAVFWLKEVKHELIKKTKVKNIIVYMHFVVVKCFSV